MSLGKNHRHTGMDLRDELIRLARDNRASAQPLVRLRISPVFPEPGKGERASVFHGDRERQLWFSRFSPFVESVRRNQAAPFSESLPERGRFIDGLSSGVNGPVSDLWVFGPIWNQSPLQRNRVGLAVVHKSAALRYQASMDVRSVTLEDSWAVRELRIQA